MVDGLKCGNSHFARVLLFWTLGLYVQSLLYIADQVGSIASGQILISERQQHVVDLGEPFIEFTLFLLQFRYFLLELPLHFSVVLVWFLDLRAYLLLQVAVLPFPVCKSKLSLQNSALELADVLLYLLQLPLLGHKFLSDEVEVIPALVLLHHLKHLFQVLPKPFVVLANLQFLFVLVDLRFDPFLGNGKRFGHNLVDMIREDHSAFPQGITEVSERNYFGVLHLLPQKVFLPHAELPPLVLVVEIRFVDVGEGLEKLP